MKKVIVIVIFCLCIVSLKAQWTISGTNIYNSNTGSVGIGVTSFLGSEKFRVVGDINLGGSQYISKAINSNAIPVYGSGLSNTLQNYYTINGAATFNMNYNYALDNLLFIQGFGQAIGGYQSGGTRNQLYMNNVHYTSTTNNTWSAATNQIVATGGTTADKLINTYIQSQFVSAAVTNYYDLYLEASVSSEPTNHWAIWQEDGNAKSYVAGKVGFGTTTPTASLHIKGGTAAANTAPLKFTSGVLLTTTEAGAIEYDGTHLYFTAANAGTRYQLDQQGGGTNFWTLSGTNIYTNTTGNVGIGTNAPGPYKLAVEGTIGARKVKVTQANPWADYVFEAGYQLPSLKEVETYIQQYKHLPEVPSAQEVNKDGLDLGDNQAVLLKKIEELTLYVIDINKKLEKLSAENSELKKKLEK